MAHPKLVSSLALAATAASLALLVGLVQSGGRGAAHERARGSAEMEPAAPAHDTLRTPLVPAPSEPAPPPPADARSSEPPSAPKPKGAHLRGSVVLPDGEPAVEARVVLGLQHGRCDRLGHFELALGDEPGDGDLVAFLPGFEPALRPSFAANLAPGHDGEVQLVLGPPTLTLAGTVVDGAGAPLKNWTVELDELDPLATLGLRERVRTDGDGRFVLLDVPTGVHVVRAWKERVEEAYRSLPVDSGATGVSIVADP